MYNCNQNDSLLVNLSFYRGDFVDRLTFHGLYGSFLSSSLNICLTIRFTGHCPLPNRQKFTSTKCFKQSVVHSPAETTRSYFLSSLSVSLSNRHMLVLSTHTLHVPIVHLHVLLHGCRSHMSDYRCPISDSRFLEFHRFPFND